MYKKKRHVLLIGDKEERHEIMKVQIQQLLHAKRKGEPIGLITLEPENVLGGTFAKTAKELRLYNKMINPLIKERSVVLNPLQGDFDKVSDRVTGVFKELYNRKQKHMTIKEESMMINAINLLRSLRGNNVTLNEVVTFLESKVMMQKKIEIYKKEIRGNEYSNFFEKEILSKIDNYEYEIKRLSSILKSVVEADLLECFFNVPLGIDSDNLYETGELLMISTASDVLNTSGDIFGMLLLTTIQDAMYNRKEKSKNIPIYIYIDQVQRYINQGFIHFLEVAQSYGVIVVLGIEKESEVEMLFRNANFETIKNKIKTCGYTETFNLKEKLA